MDNKQILYRVKISRKLAKQFTLKAGFNRLQENKQYMKISAIGRISRDILFNGQTWVYELYRITRV